MALGPWGPPDTPSTVLDHPNQLKNEAVIDCKSNIPTGTVWLKMNLTRAKDFNGPTQETHMSHKTGLTSSPCLRTQLIHSKKYLSLSFLHRFFSPHQKGLQGYQKILRPQQRNKGTKKQSPELHSANNCLTAENGLL